MCWAPPLTGPVTCGNFSQTPSPPSSATQEYMRHARSTSLHLGPPGAHTHVSERVYQHDITLRFRLGCPPCSTVLYHANCHNTHQGSSTGVFRHVKALLADFTSVILARWRRTTFCSHHEPPCCCMFTWTLRHNAASVMRSWKGKTIISAAVLKMMSASCML